MREELLHFIWEYDKLRGQDLVSEDHEKIHIQDTGVRNLGSGPDFFNAKVEIGGQLWAGNVEIHVKSSDWYAHDHQNDRSYDNVILHVVWYDDVSVFRKDNSKISTLALKQLIPKDLLLSYKSLLLNTKKTFINCENDIGTVESFKLKDWIKRLYVERLNNKSELVFKYLNEYGNDWEKTLFTMMMKSFGLNVNGPSFLTIAHALDFNIVRKVGGNLMQLESILFGLAGFLDSDQCVDHYFLGLQKEFAFLKHKFELDNFGVRKPDFFRLRPNNFPTIRLSQLAGVYHKNQNLFSKLLAAKNLMDVRSIFDVAASDYWDNHYTFGKEAKKRSKRISASFIDLAIINTVIPIKFCYAKYLGKDISDEINHLITGLKAEKNEVVHGFGKIGLKSANAFESQAIVELHHRYCKVNKCLRCAVGTTLLNRNG
ncbi:MAG: DUF2851 family protein [Bacteroidota bacterium]